MGAQEMVTADRCALKIEGFVEECGESDSEDTCRLEKFQAIEWSGRK